MKLIHMHPWCEAADVVAPLVKKILDSDPNAWITVQVIAEDRMFKPAYVTPEVIYKRNENGIYVECPQVRVFEWYAIYRASRAPKGKTQL